MNDVLFILGANDFEMRRIKSLIKENNFLCLDGLDYRTFEPCNRYTAYKIFDIHKHPSLSTKFPIFVECQPIGGLPKYSFYIDHHLPENDFFNCKGEDFMQASSLGQIYQTIFNDKIYFKENEWYIGNLKIPKKDVFTAASDHCMVAAMKGKCLGIDKNEFREFRLKFLSENSKFSDGIVTDLDLKKDYNIFESLPELSICGHQFKIIVNYIDIKFLFDMCDRFNANVTLLRPSKTNVFVHFYSFENDYENILSNVKNLINWKSVTFNAFRGILYGEITPNTAQEVFGKYARLI